MAATGSQYRRTTIAASVAVSLWVVMLAGIAIAGPLEDATSAYTRGDYATALQLWRPLADQGSASAQRNLGLMYEKGQGLPQDHAEAVRWYRKSADQGLAEALNNLGRMYYEGRGVPQNYAEALKLYRKAADQDNASALQNVGSMYYYGYGVSTDYVEAAKWFRRAADQGYATAEFSLGLMYSDGQGVPQDYVEAHKWFNLAASRFPTSEAENRDRAVNARDAVAAKMTLAQIAEAQKLAREAQEQRERKQKLVASRTIPGTRANLEKISGEAPYYPNAAIRAGIFEGKVVARLMIDEMGDVYEVGIVSAEPSRYFDKAVIDTLKQWKFRGDGKKYIGEIELKFSHK